MNVLRRALVLLVLISTAMPAGSYVLHREEVHGRLVPRRWRQASMPIPFVLSDRPLSLLPNLAPNSAVARAVEEALHAWNVGPIKLYYNGTVSLVERDWDGVNLITFADTPRNRDITVNFNAYCLSTVITQNGQVRVVDADILFNPKTLLGTDGGTSRIDIQRVMTHELGHALGLGHSPIIGTTMYPFGSSGDILARAISEDDLAGVRELYGLDPEPATGRISGQVVTTTDTPVFGAHLVALDADGIVRVGAVTESDGSFTLTSLPTGSYRVYVEPLNGPVEFADLPPRFQSERQPALRDFLLSYVGGNARATGVSVDSGETILPAPIRVEPKAPTLNAVSWVWSETGSSPWRGAQGIPLLPGTGGYLAVRGHGFRTIADSAFSFSSRDVSIRYDRTWRDNTLEPPFVVLPISVSYTAKPGKRSLFVVGNTERTVLSGIVHVRAR